MQNQRAHTKTHCSTIVKSRLTSNVSGKVSSFSFNSRVKQPVYLDFSAAWQLESKLSAHFFVYCILLLFFAFRHDNHETIFQITSSLRSEEGDSHREDMCYERRRAVVCVYYAVPITKLFAWGEGDSGGHVLRETTSRGLSGVVCPSHTSERGGEGDCVKEGG
jgi:hypothetical protein